jgi:hypothetical protein
MNNSKFHSSTLNRKSLFIIFALIFTVNLAVLCPFSVSEKVSAQIEDTKPPTPISNFQVGERLTYNISFGQFANAGYAEIYVVSRGKIGDKDAVELRSKLKTNDFVSAAFYMFDESRTTFASSETGLPLYLKKIVNAGVLPKETVVSYINAPTTNYDFLTLIYQARNTGGIGTFLLSEDEKNYTMTFQTVGAEKIKTDAGDFETNISLVQSEYLTEKGLKDFKISFNTSDQKVPVQIRFKTPKGEFKATLASIQTIVEEPETQPTPIPIQTPRTTPTPIPTPTPYLENQPLLTELPFELGETLEYQISQNGQPVGKFVFQAAERKQLLGQDSLLLTATATDISPGNNIFKVGDKINANVNPDTIAPQQIEIKFTGILSSFNQITRFDQRTGTATLNGANRMEVPVGTHSLLSLAYAIRSFNLKPSKDPQNPVNDTRVAVFWDTQPSVFTLRPSNGDIINLRGEKVSAQLISVNTGNPQLDQLNLRVWLGNDKKRLPLRFAVGAFQADLIAETIVKLNK